MINIQRSTMRTGAVLVMMSLMALSSIAQVTIKEYENAMGHLRLGRERVRAADWDAAETELRAAIELAPTLELAHYDLGQVYMTTRRFPEAVAAFLACRDAFNTNVSRRARRDSQADRQLEDHIRSLEEERDLLATGRTSLTILGGPAALDRRVAELRSRRTPYKGGVPPPPAWIEVALGSAYFRSGAMADAEREYRAAIVADPGVGEAHSNLAVVYLTTGRAADADAEITLAEKAGFNVNPAEGRCEESAVSPVRG